jgi:vitellogenic carboxypeptidase-like protein
MQLSMSRIVSIHKLIGQKYTVSQMLNLGVNLCLVAMLGLLIHNVNFHISASSSVAGESNDLPNRVFPEAALPTQSGYFTVDPTTQARMFWVFYEALNVDPDDGVSTPETPIILWLQGGPGCSSMTGNFYEIGPWHIGPDHLLHKNNNTWNQEYALLFVDNPVGAGYSVVERDEDIPSDPQQLVAQLFAALLAFFEANPGYKVRPFFVGGESYAGKYVPMLGHYIMGKKKCLGSGSAPERNGCLSNGDNLFRLDGLFIGNGLTHPIVQVIKLLNATFTAFGIFAILFICTQI